MLVWIAALFAKPSFERRRGGGPGPEIELGVREQREAELARDELAPLHSITSHRTAILLSLALTKTSDPDTIQRMLRILRLAQG